jgi:transcriptional regulator with XRE-family HTH domain
MSELSNRVRAARAYAGLTQAALAERLGIDAQSVKRTEAGKREPKLPELQAVARACRVPVKFLVEGWPATAQAAGDQEEMLPILRRLEQMVQELHEAGEAVPAPPDVLRPLGTDRPTTSPDHGQQENPGQAGSSEQ